MKMTKLATLFLTATLSLASGAALAADSGAQTNNGQANAAADAGQVAPDARENVAPNNVDNNGVNTGSGGTMLHPDGSSMNNDGMTKDVKSTRTPCAKMVAARISIKKSKPVMASTMMSIPKPTVPRSNPAK
ncbi:hypothetical protein EIMP300_68950 [Escherichia coli]|uniref:Homeobox protein n=3 Tax=Escherichia coli TaxID=562 RepID=A0A8S0FXU3_ECOLX|nr:hypothetical protein EIMP300_68950 [Escherichia coli]